jgi:hypothetical protein
MLTCMQILQSIGNDPFHGPEIYEVSTSDVTQRRATAMLPERRQLCGLPGIPGRHVLSPQHLCPSAQFGSQ